VSGVTLFLWIVTLFLWIAETILAAGILAMAWIIFICLVARLSGD